MDPATHAVIGLAISKITGNGIDFSIAASASIVIGSVFPDVDILLQKWGDYTYLKNHRGQTHSITGMAASAAFIAGVVGLIYQNTMFLELFLWAFLGCASHVFFDLFNVYGAKLLWPFYNKKFTINLLGSFDPVFIILLLGYLFTDGKTQYVFVGIFPIYLFVRLTMRLILYFQLKKKFKGYVDKVNVLPAMTNLFKWHFVIESKRLNVVGQQAFLKKNMKVIEEFNKLQDSTLEKVLNSPVGEFFKEFTPLYHVDCEILDGVRRYVFTDMRYYLRNKFMHHAVVEVDESGNILKSSFNPYSMERISKMPVHEYGKKSGLFSRLAGA